MIIEEARKLEHELTAFRRDLHRFPELSHAEVRTAGKVANRLRELSLSVNTGVGGYGVTADLIGKFPGPKIALRADMDALPIQEETNLNFASEIPGVMHACGHDVHTTALLGAAILLSGLRDRLAGSVRFIFQPAEETLTGARGMLEEGVLRDVDEIYGLHTWPTLPAGKLAGKAGPLHAATDRMEVVISGKGGHGSMPEQCHDPIVATAAVILGLHTLVSREMAPFEPAVVSIGSIHGGSANNVIPSTVTLTGTIRTYSDAARGQMPERIQRMATQVAAGYRCQAQVKYMNQVPAVVNDEACLLHARRSIEQLIGVENWVEAQPSMGGEDFALYQLHVPGCFFWLGTGSQDTADPAYGLHSPLFVVDESCLVWGAAAFASLILNRLPAEQNSGMDSQ